MEALYQSELQGVSHHGYKEGGEWKSKKTDNDATPIGKPMAELRRAMKDSGFDERLSKQLRDNKDKKWSYWSSGREKFARCFERFVQSKLAGDGRKNTYLAGPNGHEYWPNSKEIEAMTPAFESLFAAIRKDKYGSSDAVKMSIQQRKDAIRKSL